LNFPDQRAGLGIESDQPAIECADINAAAVECDAAIDHIAAYELGMIFRDVRIEHP